jgi:protein-S-isoprenylcysteine O-methyltransferase Ste14
VSLGDLTLAAWAVLEVGLRVLELSRGTGTTQHDRATRNLIGLAVGVALVLALRASSLAPSLAFSGPHRAIGLIVMWLGLALRIWAIASLGRSFRTTVEVDPGQPVITRGPYTRVRHPSYTGLILILAGFGLAVGNWLAFAACIALPLPALLHRIRVEEAEMNRVLGNDYGDYERQTKRLIPGVW